MADLSHNPSLIRVSYLLEIRMCQEDLIDDELLALGLYVVANIVGVLAEHEDTRVGEFEKHATEGKR